jgi:hypothetical protein
MDQKEDLISQHDTLKKAYDEAIAQNKLIFEVKGKPIWYMLSTDWNITRH